MSVRVAAIALAAVALAACTGDGEGATTTLAVAGGPGTAAPPPGPGSPFCDGISEMTARLNADEPPDDVGAFVAESYRGLLAVAPPDLVRDLEAMIEALTGGSAPSSTITSPSTTVAPDDVAPPVVVVTPAERVADYVAENCGRVDANPGPPPTPPSEGYDTVPDTVPPTTSAD